MRNISSVSGQHSSPSLVSLRAVPALIGENQNLASKCKGSSTGMGGQMENEPQAGTKEGGPEWRGRYLIFLSYDSLVT